MIGRIWMVASRDFVATLSSRAFLIGLLMMPVLVVVMVLLVPRVMNAHGPQVRGDIEVIDHSGRALAELRAALDPQAISARRAQIMIEALRGDGPPALQGTPPELTVIERPAGAQLGEEKRWLVEPQGHTSHHLALVVIPADAVVPTPGKADYGTYELYVSRGLNDATESVIQDSLREALVDARMKVQGINRADVQRTERVTAPVPVVVLAHGERPSDRGVRRLLPYVCGLLLFIAVITGGQALMYTMIEEKSSRVIEVLLAAVAPIELMAGKLLAQLVVGFMVLAVYVGVGLLALVQLTAAGWLEPMLLVDFALLFFVAYLTFGALMLTVGAAVSQIADAQSLLAPVMMLLVIPYVLTAFIGQAPNSPLAITLSFVPPINTFIMLARLASDSPPPGWEVVVTLGVGLLFAAFVLWFAAKVFKIGLLMHGKPPSFGTLIRWAQMA